MDENNSVMIERDYAEVLKAEFDMAIQSEEFGWKLLSVEGSTYEYHNKYHNDVSNEGKVKVGFTFNFQIDPLIMQLLHVNIWNSSFPVCIRIICS